MRSKKYLGLLFFFAPYILTFACQPTSRYHKTLLGFSPDNNQYAVGHYGTINSEGNLQKYLKICTYHAATNGSTKYCSSLDIGNVDGPLSAKRKLKQEFKKQFQQWQDLLGKKRKWTSALLDCREGDGSGRCIINVSEYIGQATRRNLKNEFYQLSAHNAPEASIHQQDKAWFPESSDQVFCYKFAGINHLSKKCASQEDIIYCLSANDP